MIEQTTRSPLSELSPSSDEPSLFTVVLMILVRVVTRSLPRLVTRKSSIPAISSDLATYTYPISHYIAVPVLLVVSLVLPLKKSDQVLTELVRSHNVEASIKRQCKQMKSKF